jgi:hypothetical protein
MLLTNEARLPSFATTSHYLPTDPRGYLQSVAGDTRYPLGWVEANAKALDSGDYGALSLPFRDLQFVGPDGDFVLCGPYTVVREAGRHEAMSGLVGRVIEHPRLPELEGLIEEICGRLGEPIPRVIPVQVGDSFGNTSAEAGEAFIVPDGWGWPGSGSGPALNNMTEQRRRLNDAGFECVERIFDSESAALLLDPLLDDDEGTIVQHIEYQFHDAGHAAGIGLHLKLEQGLLPDFTSQGIEEWRADGVDFELAARALPTELAAKLVASNFVTRFGVDAHRAGGLDRDFDMVVTLFTLDRLFRNHALRVKGGRLAFADPTPRGLLRAVELHRVEAVRLTREELSLSHTSGLARLYASLGVDKASEEVFRGLVVEPCRGVFTQLR